MANELLIELRFEVKQPPTRQHETIVVNLADVIANGESSAIFRHEIQRIIHYAIGSNGQTYYGLDSHQEYLVTRTSLGFRLQTVTVRHTDNLNETVRFCHRTDDVRRYIAALVNTTIANDDLFDRLGQLRFSYQLNYDDNLQRECQIISLDDQHDLCCQHARRWLALFWSCCLAAGFMAVASLSADPEFNRVAGAVAVIGFTVAIIIVLPILVSYAVRAERSYRRINRLATMLSN